MERRIKVSMQDATRIDQTTFHVTCTYSKSRKRSTPFPATVRFYRDKALAEYVHRVSRAVDNPSVAKAQYLLNSDPGEDAKIVFDPFYRFTFSEWFSTSPDNDQLCKTFRSIVAGIDVLYRNHHFDIGLLNCIRVDDNHNAQIVLHSRGTDDIETGVFEDMKAFHTLVQSVFPNRGLNCGLQLFDDLYFHLSTLHQQASSMRSLSYYLFHNALFYEIGDRVDFWCKLLMFRCMDKPRFNNIFFASPIPMILNGINGEWWRNPSVGHVNQFIATICENPRYIEKHRRKRHTFLLCYERFISHYQEPNFGLFEFQQIIDASYPDAIYKHFLQFAKRLGCQITFKDHEVLDYLTSVAPNSGFIKYAS